MKKGLKITAIVAAVVAAIVGGLVAYCMHNDCAGDDFLM